MKHLWTIVMVAAVIGAAAGVATAGEAPAKVEGRGQITLSWEEFVKIIGYDPATRGAQGSQVLTIPWAEVETLLGVKVEKVGGAATVDLPWTEFKSLLEWSIKRKEKPTTPPPTDYIITSTEYAGELSAEGAKFTLTAGISVLREKGWKRIPLLPTTVAITSVELPADVFLNATGKAYEVITEKAGQIAVKIEFAVSVVEKAGINEVKFNRLSPGSCVLDITIARENVDVKVTRAQSIVVKTEGATTKAAAAIPSGVPIAIAWERALPKIETVPAKLYAETRTLVSVAEGMLLCRETVNFNILHTAVRELKLQVPADCSVLDVTGKNVRDWRVDDKTALNVVLANEVIGSYSLRITYEKPAGAGVEIPVIRAGGVEREKGFIAVVALTNVEIAAGAAVSGAASIDVRQLPADIAAMTNQPILLAFRYVAPQFNIPLDIKKHGEVAMLLTLIDRAAFTGMQLNDGRRITKALFMVRNNRNQFLRLKMPAGAEIWSVEVSGKTVAPAKDGEGSVLIPLVRSARSARELSSFPVEVVYVETPDGAAPARGSIRVELPELNDAPVMHVMYSCYLPAEGRYQVGWGKSGFSGPMRPVERFTALAIARGAEVVPANAQAQLAQVEKDINARAAVRARDAGATPIRIRLPINGKLFKLEKILALPGDKLWFEVQYSRWEVAD